MSLLASELTRIKAELGYPTLTIGALPYVQYVSLFDQVVAPYLTSGATTTSSTAVTASSAGPAPIAITLASGTGFDAGARVIVDVDTRQEVATVQSIAGAVITVQLAFAHSGTYPVTVEGGESLVRAKLAELASVRTRIGAAAKTAGLKRAEDIEWYQATNGGSAVFGSLRSELGVLRDELAALLGVPNLWRVRAGAGSSVTPY